MSVMVIVKVMIAPGIASVVFAVLVTVRPRICTATAAAQAGSVETGGQLVPVAAEGTCAS